MTSNQLAYWRTEEEKRSNRAREAETARHNSEEESIAKVRNDLEAKGLELTKAANIAKLSEIWAKYGALDASQLPDAVRAEMFEALGVDPKSIQIAAMFGPEGQEDTSSIFNQAWHEIKDFGKTIWGGIKNFASLF